MYFWHTDKLVEDFRNNEVSEKEGFKYVLAWGILLSLSPVLLDPESVIRGLDSTLLFFIIIGGIYYCYRCNKNADDKDFITRFICISFPIIIKLLVFYFFIVMALIGLEVTYAVLTGGLDGYIGLLKRAEEIYSLNMPPVQLLVFGILWILCSSSYSIICFYMLGNKLKSFTRNLEKDSVNNV